jgi:hypothetical protein
MLTQNIKIVERHSALTNLPGEHQMPLDADHRGVCRYRNAHDQNFVAVAASIKELMMLTVERTQVGIPCRSPG